MNKLDISRHGSSDSDSEIDEITQSIDEITQGIDEITQGIDEITQGIDEITQGIDEITQSIDGLYIDEPEIPLNKPEENEDISLNNPDVRVPEDIVVEVEPKVRFNLYSYFIRLFGCGSKYEEL
jgi:uncharacterized phage infection (PIP) family protein YhgE